MAASSFVKVISNKRRRRIESYFQYGALGRFLITRYFNGYDDLIVIGSDTNWRVYAAWISYLKDRECIKRENLEFGDKLSRIIEFLDIYIPYEEMEVVEKRLKSLGRNDPNYLDYLKEHHISQGKDGYAREVDMAPEYYFGFIDALQKQVADCANNGSSLVIWTPV